MDYQTENETDKKIETKFYSTYIKKGDLVFDIGANVGDKSDIFLQLGATVIALEPLYNLFIHLSHRFKNNNNIHLLDMGAYSEIDIMTINTCKEKPELSTLKDKYKKKPDESLEDFTWYREGIKTVTLDWLINKYGKPKFCKIDAEGSEPDILEGLSQPIELISFEFHKRFMGDIERCFELIENLGRASYIVMFYETHMVLYGSLQLSNKEKILSMIKNHKDKLLYGDIIAYMESGSTFSSG